MAERVLLVNPAKRRVLAKITAAQRRATAKLVAFNKAKSRHKNPSKTRTSKRKKPMAKRRTAAQKAATRKLIAFNRRKKMGQAKKRRTAAYRKVRTATASKRRSPASRALPVRRRNPIQKKGIVDKIVLPAVTAASGAIILDVGWSYLPLPAMVKSGPVRHVAQAAGAVGLSYLAGMVMEKKKADQLATGALTIVLHRAAQEAIKKIMPSIQMEGVGYYSAGLPVGGPEDMGMYVSDQPAGMNTGMYVGGANGESEAAFYS